MGAPEYPESWPWPSATREFTLTRRWRSPTFFEQAAPFPTNLLPRLSAMPDRLSLVATSPTSHTHMSISLKRSSGLVKGILVSTTTGCGGVCWFNGQKLIGY